MKKTTHFETARILMRGMLKNLKDEMKLEEFCSDTFEVKSKRKTMDVVIDGEIISCKTPLTFRVEKNALKVIAPLENQGNP